MNYKVGDTPRVHTLEWFEKNCKKYGNYKFIKNGCQSDFSGNMIVFCGKKVEIEAVDKGFYYIYDIGHRRWYRWYDWMFESPDEETSVILPEVFEECLENALCKNLFIKSINIQKTDISHDIVFISGSITNNKNYKQKFAALEQKLVSKGCIVLNPALLPEGMEHDAYMPICYAMIDQSETVVFMQDWRISDGAKMEMIRAINKNKRIVFEEEI
jgi:hypothetical protein